uniref:Uncharacterized protein n=1 Tax=Setaria viridis TaxID=4556 RepID=A0A4U6W976_SETVI|nr:hypothetical protein SEVIR_1G165350v2 [Setaria viridis]
MSPRPIPSYVGSPPRARATTRAERGEWRARAVPARGLREADSAGASGAGGAAGPIGTAEYTACDETGASACGERGQSRWHQRFNDRI